MFVYLNSVKDDDEDSVIIVHGLDIHYDPLMMSQKEAPKTIAEVFYYVNYVNVNYSVKNSTVACKYLLYFL